MTQPSNALTQKMHRRSLKAPPLIEALKTYDEHQRRRFHVPAHAGFNLLPSDWDLARDPYRYDLTELEGLDVLSEPSECLADAQAAVAEIFNVPHSFFLVNGASVGLMAAMLAIVKPGDKVLLPRNVHRSVLSGLILTGAEPVWMLPERLPEWGLWGSVSPKRIEPQLEAQPDIKALFVTAPTYEGIGSDIQALAEICRRRDVMLVVDEAHGSLWPFSSDLPASACQLGADVVIHSLHKSGGSLTQSALAHLPRGSRLDAALFQQVLNTLQTTSPSYLLMASLEATCHMLHSGEGQTRIAGLLAHVHTLREMLQAQLSHYQVFEPNDMSWDPCKLYLVNPTMSGEDWGPRLEADSQLAYESASPYGVLYLASLGLEAADFEFFKNLLLAEDAGYSIDQTEQSSIASSLEAQNPAVLLPEMAMTPREAFFAPGERVAPEQAIGRVAKETIVHCPPGIPVLLPGERVTALHLPFLPESGILVHRSS